MSVEEVAKAVLGMDPKRASEAFREAVSTGMSTEEVDLEGIDGAITEAGKRYESGRLMFPQFMNTVRTAYAVREELGIPRPNMGKAVVAALDNHTEGRNTMALFLGIAGFETNIVEMGMMEDDIVGFCKEPDVTVCCVSGEFASVASKIKRIGDLLTEAGLRGKVIYNAGGMTVSEEAAERAGADVFSRSGAESTLLIKKKVLEMGKVRSPSPDVPDYLM